MSKYSKYKKKAPLEGPLSIKGGLEITRSMLTDGQKGAEAIFEKWFRSKKSKRKQILRIGGGSGSGKAQPDDTMIPTPRGMRRLDELQVGDKVFNLDGKEVPILGVYPQGIQDTYEVTFHDGRTTRCNKDHLWLVYTASQKDHGRGITPRVMPLRDIMGSIRHPHRGNQYSVPRPDPIRFRRRWVSIDPYVMGVLIGNGCLSERALTISSGNRFVPGEIGRLIGAPAYPRRYDNYSYHFGVPGETRCGGNAYIQTSEFLECYPELIGSRSDTKFIPDDYKYNSVDNRYRLLQGLMDTDGHIDKSRYRISYTTISTKLANDIVELVRSLGYEASVSEDSRTTRYKSGHCYTIHIHCPDLDKPKLFRINPRSMTLAKKAACYGTRRRETLRIISVRYVGKCSQRCIYIDDPLHVYITENYIPTHNTYFLKYLVDKYGWDRSECYIVSYTGQSVNVLRSRGLMSTTIHSAFTVPQEEPVLDADGRPIYRRGIPLTTVRFRPVPCIPSTVQLIIVDEASFLPESLEKTLCRYNVPILEVGDPIQLPPVGGKQVFHMDNLDYFIEGVMRQNENSDIYRLGAAFANGERINLNDYGDEVRFIHQQESIEDTFYQFYPLFRRADLIITSTNKQRQIITDLYRRSIIGTTSPYPREGEKLICRRNNPSMVLGEFMLSNGTQGICLSDVGRSMIDNSTKTFCMDFKPDVVAGTELYYDNLICDVDYLKQPFGTDTMTSYRHPGEKFEYAHAITTHLIQGGSAPVVLFMDSFNRDVEYLSRLRYTAVTRAVKRLYYAIPYRGEWSL